MTGARHCTSTDERKLGIHFELASDPSHFPRGSAGPIGQWSQNFRCPVLAWIFTAPDSPNEYTAKGFIGLRSFLGRLGKNGALIDIFASRMCQIGVQDAATQIPTGELDGRVKRLESRGARYVAERH
jgi:hypothetical protein